MAEAGCADRSPAVASLPVAALVFNAFVWGLSWWPLRELQMRGLHPLWSTALVYVFAVTCLLAVRPSALRGCRQPLVWLLAAASGMTNVGFNWAVTGGDVVRVVLLFYLMPAWSALLAWPLLGERPTRSALLRLVLALAGVLMVLGQGAIGWPVPQSLWDWLALAGGLSFALTNILLKKLEAVPAEARVLALFAGGAVLSGLVAGWGWLQGDVPGLPPAELAWVSFGLVLALGFLMGSMALQYGAARLRAHTTALVMLSEVVFASVSSVALGAAQMSPHVLLGGALILAAAVWASLPAGTRNDDARPQ